MSHELEIRDGRASMFTVNQTAWHREGVLLTQAPSFADALALGRLDYTVEKRPTYRIVTVDGAQQSVRNGMAFVTVRTDTEEELGSVGRDYVPMQNTDAFRILEPLIDSGIATLETGGVLRNGADAWLLVKWDLDRFGPVVREIFADELVPFGLLANNHAGRRGILLQNTSIRVVCANTLGFAEGSTERRVMVRHSAEAKSQLVAAAEALWGGIIERYEVLATQYRTLKTRVLEEEEFTRAVEDVIAPDPRVDPKFNPDAKRAELVIERADRKRGEVRRLWTEGKGHTGDHSAWEAYNAAAELLDHNRDLFPTRGGAWRTASLIDGQLHQKKDAVLSNLLEIAQTN